MFLFIHFWCFFRLIYLPAAIKQSKRGHKSIWPLFTFTRTKNTNKNSKRSKKTTTKNVINMYLISIWNNMDKFDSLHSFFFVCVCVLKIRTWRLKLKSIFPFCVRVYVVSECRLIFCGKKTLKLIYSFWVNLEITRRNNNKKKNSLVKYIYLHPSQFT